MKKERQEVKQVPVEAKPVEVPSFQIPNEVAIWKENQRRGELAIKAAKAATGSDKRAEVAPRAGIFASENEINAITFAGLDEKLKRLK